MKFFSIFEYCFVSLRRKSNQYEYQPINDSFNKVCILNLFE